MKKPFFLHPALVLLLTSLVFGSSCKKINEATLLGDALVPEVDNINTFEKYFETETDNKRLTDSGKLGYNDAVALGTITSDPEFGQTTTSVYFQVMPPVYGRSPFAAGAKTIDSVVLSLEYVDNYGDTNTPQTVRVYEMAQTPLFNDTTYYALNQSDFETTGPELGSKNFVISSLKDSMLVAKGDTTIKVANQLRIHLDKAFGERLAAYDSATAYGNDTLFKEKFRGFALKADAGTGNGLAFFALSNTAITRLTVYYSVTNGTTTDTTEAVFTHALRPLSGNRATKGGQANIIKRQPAGNWAAYLENGQPLDDKLYIQSSPGSAGYITIPGLATFENKLIHRAELIVTRIPSTLDNFFTPPHQLFVDRVKPGSDSAFLFPEFLVANNSGGTSFNLTSFGGNLRTDNTYRFNITKVVQDVIAGRLANPVLRIYAPFDVEPFNPSLSLAPPTFVQTIPYPAYGRVVVGGGNYAEQGKALRLRIVYSNL